MTQDHPHQYQRSGQQHVCSCGRVVTQRRCGFLPGAALQRHVEDQAMPCGPRWSLRWEAVHCGVLVL